LRSTRTAKGAWRDNAFVEPLRRSIKYEEVYPDQANSAEVEAVLLYLEQVLDFHYRSRTRN
jgi:hypothetical protein